MADFNNYYCAYMNMQETLKGDFTHNYLIETMSRNDAGEDTHAGKVYNRVIDMQWVEAIEEAIVYIDKAIREQRRFIVQNEDIVPIEKARKITNESVRHLAQHTNLIARVESDTVTPERILDIQREESFAIYENRFLHTLLNNVIRFVEERYKEMRNAPNDSFSKVHMTRKITVNGQTLAFDVTYSNESHEREKIELDEDISTLTDFERVRRIRRVLSDFMASSLMRALSHCEPVRPPILHTNLMTKNTNFKKSLDLWLFIETYQKKGFDVVGEEFKGKMEKNVQQEIYNVLSFEHFALCLSTNTALRKMLHENYLEENERRKHLEVKPVNEEQLKLEERVKAVREEEMQIRLEEILSREKQIKELNGAVDHQKLLINNLEVRAKEMKASIAYNQELLQKNKDQIAQLQADVLKHENTIEQQKTSIADLSHDVNQKKQQIEQYETENNQLLQKIKGVEQKNSDCLTQITQLNTIISNNTNTIATLNSQINEQKTILEQKTKQASELLKTNSQLTTAITQHKELLTDTQQEQERLKQQIIDNNIEHEKALRALKDSQQLQLLQKDKELEKEKQDGAVALANQEKSFNEKAAIINSSHEKALQNAKARFENEKQKLQRNIAVELKHNSKAIQAQADKKIKAAEKQASAIVRLAKKEASEQVAKAKRLTKGDTDKVISLYNADLVCGFTELQANYMVSLFKDGFINDVAKLARKKQDEIETIFIMKNKKSVIVNTFYQGQGKVLKKYKAVDNMEKEVDDVSTWLPHTNSHMAVITCCSANNQLANTYADALKNKLSFKQVEIVKSGQSTAIQKGVSTIGIYYYRE